MGCFAAGALGGRGGGCQHGPLHSDSCANCDGSLETHQEAKAVEGSCTRGGHYAEDTTAIDTEECRHGEVRLGGPSAADSHPSERPGKRAWASTSRHDADTPT